MQVKDVIRHLTEDYEPEDHIAVPIWQTDDVKLRAEERGMKITDVDAINIVETMDRKQDATLGITWDTIDALLDDL